ncbi:DUF2513 domain-containing protein [Sphingomonas sp.]|uniref:DUF2513 domain-containing protein n=1 Tax=Sphingomonas sp. TaxID=28214 RepID=UPI0025DBDFC5|nr:DUF2513 domain-containing protein [Sphingomonas sp.]
MKRDMDLCRKIMEQVEEKSNGLSPIDIEIEGYARAEVSYQIMIMNEGGYLTAADASTRAGLHWMARRLTWQGHEFLDAVRNDTVWIKVKETVKEKGGTIPFEVLKALAIKFAGSVFGL